MILANSEEHLLTLRWHFNSKDSTFAEILTKVNYTYILKIHNIAFLKRKKFFMCKNLVFIVKMLAKIEFKIKIT